MGFVRNALSKRTGKGFLSSTRISLGHVGISSSTYYQLLRVTLDIPGDTTV